MNIRPRKSGAWYLPGHGKSRYLCLFLFAFFPWQATSFSQEDTPGAAAGLTASLDRDSARVGSIVELTFVYHLPEGTSLSEDPEIGGLENLTVLDRQKDPARIRIRLLVDRIDSWKTGALSLTCQDKDGNQQILKADPVSLTILSNLGEKPEEARLRPIQGIIPTRSGWLKHLPLAGGLLGLLFVLLGLVWWYKNRRRKGGGSPLADPPHIKAGKEIADLERQGLFESGQIKEFYFRFSGILRRYLESIRGFPAAEFTTEEIGRHMDNELDRRLLPLLQQADFIKFAEAVPSQAGKEEEVERAVSYIHDTSPALESGSGKEAP